MANFKIKYLDKYPVATFYESFEYPEAVFDGWHYDIQKTSRKWGHVYDSIKENRTTQYIVYEKYKAELIIGRNIDLFVLQGSNHVLVTPDYGDAFNALDFNIEISDSPNRDKVATITFKKEVEIRYPLSSDYAESIHSTSNVNKISFDVDNPAYVFNNIVTYTVETGPSSYQAYFKVPLTDLSNTILVDDIYYLHTDNPTFNAQKDNYGDYLDYAKCKSKDSSFVYFECSNDEVSPSLTYTITNLIIDHSADYRDLPSAITVADKTISLEIYTFIEPYYSHMSELAEGYEAPDATEENQKGKEHDVIEFKIWLLESEKWKAEYLNYALNEDIEIELVNYDNIIPTQTKDIITPVENENFIDLFEYDIKVKYNAKSVNIFR
jgi:hypothetical protein